jgi:NADPH:quinone reductase-like Zn-dependent oxidoreductase
MNAVVFHEHGGPGKLQYQEMPMPTIGVDEVLVRVKACALNHLDIWIRQGSPAYPMPLPHILGSDISGVVHQIGSHVEGVAEGERVYVSPGVGCGRCEHCWAGRDNMCRSYGLIGAMCHGGYAEYVKVPARNVFPIPGALSFEQAAAFPLVSVTAWHMLFGLAALQPGEDVLIMGAGSGVGHMAIQMAKLAGARVLTTVGSDDKAAKAKALGADEVINHTPRAGEPAGAGADPPTRSGCGDRTHRPGGMGAVYRCLGQRRSVGDLWRDDGRGGETRSAACIFDGSSRFVAPTWGRRVNCSRPLSWSAKAGCSR